MSIERRIQPDERYRFGWCCDQDFENGTYRTTPECIRETAADRVAVRRAGLKALLRRVDPGGFWSRELGIRYEPGSDDPVAGEPDTGTEALRAALDDRLLARALLRYSDGRKRLVIPIGSRSLMEASRAIAREYDALAEAERAEPITPEGSET
jgi:hypothetical protein